MFFCWMQLNNVSINTKLHSKLLCLESERTLHIKTLQELWMVLMCNIHWVLLKFHPNNAVAFSKTEQNHSLKKMKLKLFFNIKLFVAFYPAEIVLQIMLQHITFDSKEKHDLLLQSTFSIPWPFFSLKSKCLRLKVRLQGWCVWLRSGRNMKHTMMTSDGRGWLKEMSYLRNSCSKQSLFCWKYKQNRNYSKFSVYIFLPVCALSLNYETV